MKNMDIWVDKIANATNRRMLEQWALHKPQTIKATSTQDLDPEPLAANDHPSVLPHELFALEPGVLHSAGGANSGFDWASSAVSLQ